MGEVNRAVRVWEPGRCSSARPARGHGQITWTVTCPPGRNAHRGTVLREVDACCVVGDADEERQASWRVMNAFAAELVRLHATVFRLNYDSLLMSALLGQGAMVYDGFRFGALNVPLDRWSEPVTLYQLHGSVGWRRAADGLVYLVFRAYAAAAAQARV
jgi:hypothetical protein